MAPSQTSNTVPSVRDKFVIAAGARRSTRLVSTSATGGICTAGGSAGPLFLKGEWEAMDPIDRAMGTDEVPMSSKELGEVDGRAAEGKADCNAIKRVVGFERCKKSEPESEATECRRGRCSEGDVPECWSREIAQAGI